MILTFQCNAVDFPYWAISINIHLRGNEFHYIKENNTIYTLSVLADL